MTISNIYLFPASSNLPSPPPSHSSTIVSRRRVRSRTLSLLSTNSGISKGFNGLESPKAGPTTWTSNSFQNHQACGSFVPNTPATAALRAFLPSMITHTRGRARYISSHPEKELQTPPSPSSPVPFITRTLPLSSESRSPSPTKIHNTLPKLRRAPRNRTASEVHSNDLHPILAGLEERSRFCTKKGTCATCNRIGSGFPQCAKCGDSWCSRECRLNGGKKHFCRNRPA